MQDPNQEIVFIVAIGGIIALLLVGFIVTILFLYQRRQHKQEKEIAHIKEKYDQELLRSQLEIQENTLKQIAQELHDNIGLQLSLLKFSLIQIPIEKTHPAYENILGCRQVINTAAEDIRMLSKKLHTDRIAHVGLLESIQFELENIRKTGLNIEYESTVHRNFFSDQTAIFIYRMFQEIFNNILKHAKATQVNVHVFCTEDNTFVLQIEDNGVGFKLSDKHNNPSTAGVGLKSMSNRASLIGAKFNINSIEGKGTTVSLSLPLPKES